MSGCRCRTCATPMIEGPGITITGGGTTNDPKVISATGGGATVETGCGLTGDGTTADPVTAAPAAGEEAWPWTCDVADGSTLKCDPGTSELWTPPEHDFFTDNAPTDLEISGNVFPPTGGPVQANVVALSINLPPSGNFLLECRSWEAIFGWHFALDVSYTADAEFEIGLEYEPPPPGAQEFFMKDGVLDTGGVARREIMHVWFQRTTAGGPNDPSLQYWARPAIDVSGGTVTINSALTERWRIVSTVT